MPKLRAIADGDSVESVALDNGLFWQSVWNHPENAALRKLRKDQPNILEEEDQLFLPVPNAGTANSSSTPPNLRHSREMTRVCSRRVTHRPGGAGDDKTLPISGLSARTRFRGWATLSEHKWSSFGERRHHQIGSVVFSIDCTCENGLVTRFPLIGCEVDGISWSAA